MDECQILNFECTLTEKSEIKFLQGVCNLSTPELSSKELRIEISHSICVYMEVLPRPVVNYQFTKSQIIIRISFRYNR